MVETFFDAVARKDRFAALRTLSAAATITFGDDKVADITRRGDEIRRVRYFFG